MRLVLVSLLTPSTISNIILEISKEVYVQHDKPVLTKHACSSCVQSHVATGIDFVNCSSMSSPATTDHRNEGHRSSKVLPS
jgi:hypothetical protein